MQALEMCGKPFRCILGNDDWFDVEYKFRMKLGEAFGDIVAFDLVNITPFQTNREANENQIAYELGRINITKESIILAHAPPYYKQDKTFSGERVGSRSIRNCIDDLQPKIWICGHIHESYGVSQAGNTLVVNCACNHTKNEFRGFIIDTKCKDCIPV